MPRVCRCGKVVDRECECREAYRIKQRRDVTSEGHGHDHRVASERYRVEHPLCERCVMLYGVMHAQPSRDMHHIAKIKDAPHERMQRTNWLALCRACHEYIEGDVLEGMKVKRWSQEAYHAMVGD